MFTFKHFKLSDINSSVTPMNLLYEIFKRTLNPFLTMREFKQYYFSQHPDEMDITLLYDNEQVVGFYSAAFYPRIIDGKKVIICRSALGLLKNQQKGRLPLGKLFAKFIKYKLQHLFTPLYITAFMANPIMYAMICKYTKTVYPRRNKTIPVNILQFKETLLQAMGMSNKEIAPFVLKIHFQVHFSEEEIARFESSVNEDVKYYLSINPGYSEQNGVMVLLPVTCTNILYTCMRRLWVVSAKKIRHKAKKTFLFGKGSPVNSTANA